MNKVWANYWGPTPQRWRKVGASILHLGMMITTYATLSGQAWAIASLMLTWIGTTITDFFSEDVKRDP